LYEKRDSNEREERRKYSNMKKHKCKKRKERADKALEKGKGKEKGILDK